MTAAAGAGAAAGTCGLFAVDAGGSRTRVLVAPAASSRRLLELPSINRSAAGHAADDTLGELFAAVRRLLPVRRAVGWLASASVDPDRVHAELERIRLAAHRAGLSGALVVSNDVVPLLWGVPALAGEGVVVVCGTGAGFFGADRRGRTARAGGCEYLGSDEGGAVDIGQCGLRAAVRAADGRGPSTALAGAFAEAFGCPAADLARRLAGHPFPKQLLGRLAPVVCAAWLRGDEVADRIVDRAVGELVTGVRAVRERLALPDGFPVAAAGGVLTGCPEMYRQLAGRLEAELRAGSVDLVGDTASAVLAGLGCLLGDGSRPVLPRGHAGRHLWTLAC